uniref:EF-hand domain-containing protein n=1 Tax=Lotharella globosa TaxID=91324 RepID=A0A6V3KDW7_9EUKA
MCACCSCMCVCVCLMARMFAKDADTRDLLMTLPCPRDSHAIRRHAFYSFLSVRNLNSPRDKYTIAPQNHERDDKISSSAQLIAPLLFQILGETLLMFDRNGDGEIDFIEACECFMFYAG